MAPTFLDSHHLINPVIAIPESNMRDLRVRRGLAAGADQAVVAAVQRDLRRQSRAGQPNLDQKNICDVPNYQGFHG